MFNIGISRHAYLLLVCSGGPTYNDFLAMIDLASNVAAREGWTRVLVDCMGVPATFTADERVALGKYAATALSGKRVGLVVPSTERFDVTQSAAASAGGMLRYFRTHQDADTWLA